MVKNNNFAFWLSYLFTTMVCYNASITSPKHRCMLMHIAPICLSISSFILP